MTVDPEAPPPPHMVLTLLGEYEIPKVSVPLQDLPTLLLLLGLLEKMFKMLDLLMDLMHAVFLALMLDLTPPIFSPPSPSMSTRPLITPHLVLSWTPPAAIMQLLVPTIALPMYLLQTTLPENIMIPAVQAVSLFGVVPPATTP